MRWQTVVMILLIASLGIWEMLVKDLVMPSIWRLQVSSRCLVLIKQAMNRYLKKEVKFTR